jgi:hypothetical protein
MIGEIQGYEKEWYIGTRYKDGTIRVGQTFENEEKARERFAYLTGPWRKMLEEEAANEDLKKTNLATRVLKEKKEQTFLLMYRHVYPYMVQERAPDWD